MSRTRRNHSQGVFDEDREGRDLKPYNKPPKWFKKLRRRKERTKARQQLHEGFEPELVPHADQWDWD